MRASLFWDSGVFTYTFMLVSVMQLIFDDENFNAKGAFLFTLPNVLLIKEFLCIFYLEDTLPDLDRNPKHLFVLFRHIRGHQI
ncbi:hypothetical protein VNO80_09771 [Phaseolus coccineus]|uniref:Uncharacterized protein n=1 Tax=Phaseolus coccineus TaxID=3886 RepID=A0AAN9NC51_PHACN